MLGSEGLPRGMENFGGALEAFSKASSFCWSVSWIDGESAGSSGGLLDYYQGVVEDEPCAQLSLHLYVQMWSVNWHGRSLRCFILTHRQTMNLRSVKGSFPIRSC